MLGVIQIIITRAVQGVSLNLDHTVNLKIIKHPFSLSARRKKDSRRPHSFKNIVNTDDLQLICDTDKSRFKKPKF